MRMGRSEKENLGKPEKDRQIVTNEFTNNIEIILVVALTHFR
jgi:hypothetical protein